MVDLSAQKVLSAGEIEQKLASHQLYVKTEYHEGHRADCSSADLTRFDFAGLDLRGIKMDRALLRGANFIGADLRGANLIGATLQRARLNRSNLSRARLSGANLVSASFENACLAKAEMEFALMAKAVLRGACLCALLRGANFNGAAPGTNPIGRGAPAELWKQFRQAQLAIHLDPTQIEPGEIKPS